MTYEEYRASNPMPSVTDDCDSQERIIAGFAKHNAGLISKLQETLNKLVAGKFTLGELHLIYRSVPQTYYLSQAELYMLWEAFSETACASWLFVTKESVKDFVKWIQND